MPPSSKQLTRLAFITVCLAWGTIYVAIHIAVEAFHPFQLSTLRFLLAGGLLMLALRLRGIPPPPARDWPWIILVGLLLLTGANTMVGWASRHLPSTYISLLINLSPLIYVTLAQLTGEKVARRAWAGLLLGLLGLLLLLWPRLDELRGGAHSADPYFWPALGIVLMAPFLWATGSLISARHKLTTHPLMMAASQSLVGGIGAGLLGLAGGGIFESHPIGLRPLLAIAWLIVVGSWLGYVAYLYCLLHLRSSTVALTTYMNTITALVCGGLVLGERITPFMLAGGAVMLAGVALAQSARAPG